MALRTCKCGSTAEPGLRACKPCLDRLALRVRETYQAYRIAAHEQVMATAGDDERCTTC